MAPLPRTLPLAADRSSDRSLDRLSDRSDKLTPPAASSVPAEDIQRWTAGRKAAVVPDLIRGRVTTAEIARQFNLTVAEVDSWVRRFMEGGKEGLRAVPRDVEARHNPERKDQLVKVGELTLQVDALKKTSRSA